MIIIPDGPASDPPLIVHLLEQAELHHRVLLRAAGVIYHDVRYPLLSTHEVRALPVDVQSGFRRRGRGRGTGEAHTRPGGAGGWT